MRTKSRVTVVSVVVGLVAAASASAAMALPGLPAYSGPIRAGKNPVVKPGSIVYTGDGSGFLAGPGKTGRRPKAGKLKWTSWSGKGATATGEDWINNCLPDCADGKFSTFPVALKASRPRVVLGHKIFTRLKVTWTGSRPKFIKHHVELWKVRTSQHDYFWNFPA
jgi:hypothetical protein